MASWSPEEEGGDLEGGSSQGGSSPSSPSVRDKIALGLAAVKRNLAKAFSDPGSGEGPRRDGDLSPEVSPTQRKLGPNSSIPRGGVVGCEVTRMSKKEGRRRRGRVWADHADALAPAAAGAEASLPLWLLPRADSKQRQPDWADGLPPDFLERLAHQLNESCSTEEWDTVQNVYNASAVCRTWRAAIRRACFERSALRTSQNTPRASRKRAVRRTLSDRMLCHPSQLIERLATTEDTIHCYIVREKTRGPFSYKRYRLVLGEDYSKQGKTLLVANHHLLATKSAYNIYLSSSEEAYSSSKRLGHLQSSPYGTTFELHSATKMSGSGSVRRTKSGNIKYSFNMLGGRGPRSVQVNLADEEALGAGGVGPDEHPPREESSGAGDGWGHDEPETVLENKLPRWHELLQCWCLDFGGRVKCASVKNFQLVSRDDPDEIILQFGKVEPDVFTMDFKPKLLSAQQAFMICLSSFDSKLSCF
ncbi:tubby-like protein [Chloropicon primus]|uniref:Tubby-like protein n=1 Tax=Chloropicon primus TaxID=1764295 RepID=A0A5B8MI33_9CHLO|nr:tubby-like protein [Chloropicon primus]UPQ99162.1 tubby-like protein [Chloropicon primus]|mmetsp:Transcript_10858/g.30546  ORF Transcript_10858/g.30546 Transcript_10858/m.30546 type:complete len:475 (-) Transcript_10858:95-1519(-)|eukprot:QDZ19951.1 tubby-like protein [Chloropicon primus]